MKYALQQISSGETRIVDANGQPLGSGDADRPILHILPKLFVPAEALGPLSDRYEGLTCDAIELEVTSTLTVDVAPEGGIIVRQPYPNRRYFVGGSPLIRNGWIVPLPLDTSEFDIEFNWRIEGPGVWRIVPQDQWEVRHLIHIKLHPGKGMTYSMDSSCWPERNGPAMRFSPVTPIMFEDADPKERLHRQIVSDSNLVYRDGDRHSELAGYFLEENVDITGIPMEQAYTIDGFQEEQLHEVRQTAVFKQDNETHRANALVEMPAELFVQAVKLAKDIPFDADSDFARSVASVPGGFERHPALRQLCEWWATARPSGEPFKPGAAMPLVRVRDDGEYWWGHYEIPNVPIDGFNPDGRNAARIGDLMLILFQAEQDSAVFDQNGMHICLPSGASYNCIGIDKKDYLEGEHDEAWSCLNALSVFSSRYPKAWDFLNKHGGEYRMARRAEVALAVQLPEGTKPCPNCQAMPVLTEDPTGETSRFLLECEGHGWTSGDTIEEVIYDWNRELEPPDDF